MMPSRRRKFIPWGHRRIHFLDQSSLLSNLGEIFVNRIYDFGPINSPPFIIDCGGNIGLAGLYWKERYGRVEGVSIEPDPQLSEIIHKNFATWGCQMRILTAAVSFNDGHAPMRADGTDGGRLVSEAGHDSTPVRTLRLSRLIDRPIDFLKLDIEGSELTVLEEAKDHLRFVKRLFVECHLFDEEQQDFSEILRILRDAGFRCAVAPGVEWCQPWRRMISRGLIHSINISATRIKAEPDLQIFK